MMVLPSHSPRFPDIKGSKQGQPGRTYTLSWNPCTQFSDDKCENVLVSNVLDGFQWNDKFSTVETV